MRFTALAVVLVGAALTGCSVDEDHDDKRHEESSLALSSGSTGGSTFTSSGSYATTVDGNYHTCNCVISCRNSRYGSKWTTSYQLTDVKGTCPQPTPDRMKQACNLNPPMIQTGGTPWPQSAVDIVAVGGSCS